MKKWFKDSRIKKYVIMSSILAGIVLLMGFVSGEQADKTIKDIYVHIDYRHDNYFVGKSDVLNLITLSGADAVIGQYVDNISLKELEVRVKSHNFVEDAQVYKDHKGNLTVNVTQCKPIARIIDPKGPNAYIGENGNSLPSSAKFTARVMLIDGPYAEKLKNTEFLKSDKGKAYFDLISYISRDRFWKAQIAQMTVDRGGEIVFYTQIGDQRVEFGKPDDIEEKFQKLKIFYKRIYPFKGYNHYKRVSLKFKNQIVCE